MVKYYESVDTLVLTRFLEDVNEETGALEKLDTRITLKDLARIFDRLHYKENASRGMVLDKKTGIEKPILSTKNISEMSKFILNGGQFENRSLIWNIGVSNITYDTRYYSYLPNNNGIQLNLKDLDISIPDSNNRHRALIEVVKNTNDPKILNQVYDLKIFFLPSEREQNLFWEFNGAPLKVNQTRSLYTHNAERNKMIKNIINKSSLRDNIEVTKPSTVDGTKLFTFNALFRAFFDTSKGIYKNYTKQEDLDKLEQMMILYFNELCEVRPELKRVTIDERKMYNKLSLVGNNITVLGYVKISKLLMSNGFSFNKNWNKHLKELKTKPYVCGKFKGDLFSLDNPIWHNVVCHYNDKTGNWIPDNNYSSYDYVADKLVKHLLLDN